MEQVTNPEGGPGEGDASPRCPTCISVARTSSKLCTAAFRIGTAHAYTTVYAYVVGLRQHGHDHQPLTHDSAIDVTAIIPF